MAFDQSTKYSDAQEKAQQIVEKTGILASDFVRSRDGQLRMVNELLPSGQKGKAISISELKAIMNESARGVELASLCMVREGLRTEEVMRANRKLVEGYAELTAEQ